MDAISALATISGLTDNSDDSEKQQQYQLQLMDKQSQINKNASAEQEAAQMRIFEKTGYAARVRQMKEAGLNPGLIYGTGASGGGGVTGNISAAQVSQGSAPNVAGARQAKTQAMGMNLELAKLASEIEVNKSVAEANRSEAAYKSGVQTEKTGAEIANLSATREGQELQNYNQKITNAINTATSEANIRRINYLADESAEALKILQNNAQISSATKEAAIQQTTATLEKTLAETLKINSEKALTDQTVQKIISEIKQKWTEIGQNYDRMQIEISRILYDNDAQMDRAKLQAWSHLAGTITGLVNIKGLNKMADELEPIIYNNKK